VTALRSCLYAGEVVHRRLSPVRHELRYSVFNLFADIDELPELGKRLRLFSYNRFNLFSVNDRSHGPGDGTPLKEHVWGLVAASPMAARVRRVFIFCYPRVLGYVFNPLTVYYGFDSRDELCLMIYEVNNTFGGRHSYVIPVGPGEGQSCAKRFYVSPFNAVEGDYGFRFSAPAERMALGITLTADKTPVLKAYVSGRRETLNDANLLRSFARIPFLTFKVIGAIHWQAAKLWLKGLRLKPEPPPPPEPVLIADRARHAS
jgi:uncharacterized protein